jgi:hypothetical protein
VWSIEIIAQAPNHLRTKPEVPLNALDELPPPEPPPVHRQNGRR